MDPALNNDANNLPSPVHDAMASLAGDAKTRLEGMAEPVKEKVMEVAESQKDIGADQLSIVARAIHGAASELHSEMPEIAQYVHSAGAKVEKTASDLRAGSIEELMGKLGRLARTQPVTDFGSAIIAGFAITRFAKATNKPVVSQG
jgi:uncharacterized protein YjbJ (UPF0337 family)